MAAKKKKASSKGKSKKRSYGKRTTTAVRRRRRRGFGAPGGGGSLMSHIKDQGIGLLGIVGGGLAGNGIVNMLASKTKLAAPAVAILGLLGAGYFRKTGNKMLMNLCLGMATMGAMRTLSSAVAPTPTNGIDDDPIAGLLPEKMKEALRKVVPQINGPYDVNLMGGDLRDGAPIYVDGMGNTMTAQQIRDAAAEAALEGQAGGSYVEQVARDSVSYGRQPYSQPFDISSY